MTGSGRTAPGATPSHRATGTGGGRLLVAVYGVLAIAATARGLYQVGTKLDEAPVAYVLSLAAGIVYVVATVALARDRRATAWVAVVFELVGVLTVGTLSVVDVGDFPDETVWSRFGAGYGYVPLVLPFVGLWWLRRTGDRGAAVDGRTPSDPPAVG
ncbi:hypothetical protein J1G42_09155 [Cellulomonas sp. zg-ZUI222]|uniref:Integral membrane protein n=1 Tax=Cellulomonas wangleii TaxID=2816956 RepID=A0ABX8D1U0_9CELL|nr:MULTISPECIES: hypothetical protein [Cellulomonas]MBO0900092.1 hypothetical protein [Cellulomonas sp. zg-ZUI22]MBO0920993.1 hypothetical protein [Cellulomonas wangleii]MBO0925525.1 hypothetical protein [Cellulomonas wangleii]QVI61006.1 hypothetical protein KG103_10750 [Cellulomonas wangleii]